MDTETTQSNQGYFSRIGNAMGGVIFGLVLFAISFPVLFWNEGRAVQTAKTLAEGASVVIEASPDSLDPANDTKLVHLVGSTVGQNLTDQSFNVSADAIHLRRIVQMYQWKESEESHTSHAPIGGGQTTTTTYRYDKVWSDTLIDSSRFHSSASHSNPSRMPVDSQTLTASIVTVGPYALSPGLISQIEPTDAIAMNEGTRKELPAQTAEDIVGNGVIQDGWYFVGVNPAIKPDTSDPAIGDIKIGFRAARPGVVSIIARQTESNLSPYVAHTGKTIEILKPGTRSQKEMFAEAVMANHRLTWIMRLVGFLIMWIGLMTILAPLRVLADVVGVIGDIVGMGIGLVSLVLAGALSTLTIALAWILYRPLLGIGLLAVAAAFIFWLRVLHRKKSQLSQPGLPPLPPMPGQ